MNRFLMTDFYQLEEALMGLFTNNLSHFVEHRDERCVAVDDQVFVADAGLPCL